MIQSNLTKKGHVQIFAKPNIIFYLYACHNLVDTHLALAV